MNKSSNLIIFATAHEANKDLFPVFIDTLCYCIIGFPIVFTTFLFIFALNKLCFDERTPSASDQRSDFHVESDLITDLQEESCVIYKEFVIPEICMYNYENGECCVEDRVPGDIDLFCNKHAEERELKNLATYFVGTRVIKQKTPRGGVYFVKDVGMDIIKMNKTKSVNKTLKRLKGDPDFLCVIECKDGGKNLRDSLDDFFSDKRVGKGQYSITEDEIVILFKNIKELIGDNFEC